MNITSYLAALLLLASPRIAASATRKSKKSKAGFDNSSLKGRFSYYNKEGDVASISVGVFDGIKNITSFEDICANVPDGNGGRTTATIGPFNWGYYEVQASGRGKIYISLGVEGDRYYDPPAELEFVVTSTDGSEITGLESFQVADAGLVNNLVVPRWSKIADE